MQNHDLNPDQLDGIVLKVQKLLALSRSSNEHEAALAAARAQDLLFRYNLDLAMVSEHGSTAKQPYERHGITLGKGKAIEWKRDLIFALTRHNFCRAVFFSGTDRMAVVGQRHNFEAVMGMYDYLSKSFERMVERAFTEYRLADGSDHHMSYKASWLKGAVLGVLAQLQAMRASHVSESAQTSALVLVTDSELDKALEDAFGAIPDSKSNDAASVAGLRAGFAAGTRISLAKQVSGSDQGAKALA
jgi:hypothetical protein